ncbi:MAG: paraquat-inducible protein A [Nitrococcus mobilis]|nr:paraquat-inducible protein A [Nitrococcus mobilis]
MRNGDLSQPFDGAANGDRISIASSRLTRRRRLRACQGCDLVVALPPLRPNERADCPRCGYLLVRRNRLPAQRGLALASAAFICLSLAVLFPFVGFRVQGVTNRIELIDAPASLLDFGEYLVAISVLLTVLILPALYLLGLIWLHGSLLRNELLPQSRAIARAVLHLTPWMMADVFVVATLVSLIKIVSLGQVGLGPAFWFFCAFAVLLLKTNQSVDADWLWFALAGEPPAPPGTRTGETAAGQGLVGCAVCGLINRLDEVAPPACRRCGERLHTRHPYSLQRTYALLATAAVLYVPANVYPIMTTTVFGASEPSTIIGGVLSFAYHGDLPVALIIFTASVLVPVSKILALGWLCMNAQRRVPRDRGTSARVYRVVEFIGRWSMVDVFVVAILVALLRAGALLSITPGLAALAFASVVVVSMFAAMSFDPRLLWDAPRTGQEKGRDD